MRIKTISIHVTEEDHDKLTAGADALERTQLRPRPRANLKDFLVECGLAKADELLKQRLIQQGKSK